MQCCAKGCTNPATYTRLKLCKKHYDRRRYQGDENARPTYTRGFSESEKLAHYREIPDDPDGCFGWSGRISTGGYAMIWAGGNRGGFRSAHRTAYTLEKEPIPVGFQVDHECHNRDMRCPGGTTCLHRRCTNPRHLQAKTRVENVRAARRSERPRS